MSARLSTTAFDVVLKRLEYATAVTLHTRKGLPVFVSAGVLGQDLHLILPEVVDFGGWGSVSQRDVTGLRCCIKQSVSLHDVVIK
jgi:hypothetical protein